MWGRYTVLDTVMSKPGAACISTVIYYKASSSSHCLGSGSVLPYIVDLKFVELLGKRDQSSGSADKGIYQSKAWIR